MTSIPVWLRTDHPREVAEAELAHKVRNGIESAYSCSDLFEVLRRVPGFCHLLASNGSEAILTRSGKMKQLLHTDSSHITCS